MRISDKVNCIENSKNVPIWAEKEATTRGAVERGDVRKSLLYFSLKDAMPYFSGTTATERITGCYGLVMWRPAPPVVEAVVS